MKFERRKKVDRLQQEKMVQQAQEILKELGLPVAQQNERSALSLLALANLNSTSDWKNAKQLSMSVVGNKTGLGKYPGVMQFINENFSKVRIYKENSRESFRKETLRPFVQAGICEHNPEEPGLAPNSPKNHYRLTIEVTRVIRSYGTNKFKEELEIFREIVGTLTEKYAKARKQKQIPIKLADGTFLDYAPGTHNELQAAIINDFASRFAHGSVIVYLGDTEVRDRYLDKSLLATLKVPLAVDTKLPDIILYDKDRDWLYLIEAVHSGGPISPQRLVDLEKMLSECKSGKIYVTAFPSRTVFRSHIANIAWETEVWIADNPTHMIHFNGDRFIGPRN